MTTHDRIRGAVAAMALTLGVCAASASARTFDIPASASVGPATAAVTAQANLRSAVSCGDVCSGGYGSASLPASNSTESGATLPHAGRAQPSAVSSAYNSGGAPRTVVRVLTHDGGFNWGDAGIGAGGVLLLSILGIGGVMAFSHRRIRHGGGPLTT